MKNLNDLFYLSVRGYLKDLVTKDGWLIALLLAITQHSTLILSKDEVWMQSDVGDVHLQVRLNHLFDSVHAGRKVIITFKAEFSGFLNAHSCLSPSDSNHIATLQSRLRVLEDCYIDGRPVEMKNHQLKAVV